MSKEPDDSETLRNAAKICIALLKAAPYDLIDGTNGRLKCAGKIRMGKGWGWVDCGNYAEPYGSLCAGPCESTWGPR